MLFQFVYLGEFHVVAVNGERVRFRDRRTACLAAFLFHHARPRHSRDELAALLWPESAQRAGRNSLNTALSSIRRALTTPDFSPLRCDLDTVETDRTGVLRDIDAFEAMARRARADARFGLDAIGLYAGAFLDGFYDDWAVSERARLHGLFCDTLDRTIDFVWRDGDRADAIALARRHAAEDPHNADGHARLIALLRADGQEGAARQYEAHCAHLGLTISARRIPATAVADTAAPRNAHAFPTPEPAPLNPFVGRSDELAGLIGRLEKDSSERLLTLTGPGGCGKTRLAQEVVRKLARHPENRVAFVPLLPARTAESVARIVAARVGTRADNRPWLETIREALSHEPALLILDNLEHLPADAILPLVRAILDRCERTRILATSRHRLGLPGEREIVLKPLEIPPDAALGDRADLCDSVRLFVERARDCRGDFALDGTNRARVFAICRRLDGLPLSIELAAARLHTQSLAQIESSVQGGDASLEGAISSSVARLGPRNAALLISLSVFSGGFTHDAVEAVFGDMFSGLDLGSALLSMRLLSLVTVTEQLGVLRYDMLDSIRSFCAARLGPDDCAAVRLAHARWCVAVAARAEPNLFRETRGTWLDGLRAEEANFDAALRRARRERDGARLLDLCEALGMYWAIESRYAHGHEWLSIALDDAPRDAPVRTRARALMLAGIHAQGCLEVDVARARFDDAVALFRAIDDLKGLAESLGRSVTHERYLDPETPRKLDECLALARRIGHAGEIGAIDNRRCSIALIRGDLDDAERFGRSGLAGFEANGDIRAQAFLLSQLGDCAKERGEFARARKVYQDCGERFARIQDAWGMVSVAMDLTRLCLLEGDLDGARREFAGVVERATANRLDDMLPFLELTVGLLAQESGDLSGARDAFVRAGEMARERRAETAVGIALTHEALIRVQSLELDLAAKQLARALTHLAKTCEPKRESLCLLGFAAIHTQRNDLAAGAVLLGAVDIVTTRFVRVHYPFHAALRAETGRRLRAGLKPDEFSALATIGSSLARQALDSGTGVFPRHLLEPCLTASAQWRSRYCHAPVPKAP